MAVNQRHPKKAIQEAILCFTYFWLVEKGLFTHYSWEQTRQIRCHMRCSVASHCSDSTTNAFSLTSYSKYVTKTLHIMYTMAKNSIHYQWIVKWVRCLTEMCGKALENYIVVSRCYRVLLVITKLLYLNYGIDWVKNKTKMNIQRLTCTGWEDFMGKSYEPGALLGNTVAARWNYNERELFRKLR